MSKPQITIRPATEADLPTLSIIDNLANKTRPFLSIGLGNVSPSARDALFLSRLEYLFLHDPSYRFLVATTASPSEPQNISEEKIAGFLVWKLHTP